MCLAIFTVLGRYCLTGKRDRFMAWAGTLSLGEGRKTRRQREFLIPAEGELRSVGEPGNCARTVTARCLHHEKGISASLGGIVLFYKEGRHVQGGTDGRTRDCLEERGCAEGTESRELLQHSDRNW